MPVVDDLSLWDLDHTSLDQVVNTPLQRSGVLVNDQISPPNAYYLEEYINSARGLLGRVILPNNQVALRDDVFSIHYELYNRATGEFIDEGDLDPAEVMLEALSGPDTWDKDDVGYSFLWPADVWTTAGIEYQTVILFLLEDDLVIKRVWRVLAYDPATV